MRSSGLIWFIIAAMILVDVYVFIALRTVTQQLSPKLKMGIFSGYWVLVLGAALLMIFLPYLHFDNWSRTARTTIFALLTALFFSQLLASVFFLIDDLRRGITWLALLVSRNMGGQPMKTVEGISRSAFLSWVGLAAGGGLFSTFMYGLGNKYRYQLKRIRLSLPKLPPGFQGMKIVQLSDIHSGSLTDRKAVEKGVKMVMDLKPDLILFTGDLVNDRSDEMDEEFIRLFGRLKAPMGVYAVLGNHDYGDYAQWDSVAAKQRNLEQLKEIIAKMGWRLLMNEHVVLERGGDAIALLGIENWSAKSRFPRYGKMKSAYPGSENYPVKILLSHDPSHWDAEVRPQYPDIDLMLSGHTHGMQFGLEVPGFKWSPVQYIYKEWAGLYREGNQQLYVNRGFGFIGYPGRVGILPEITLFTAGK